jgi:hypothetical protein
MKHDVVANRAGDILATANHHYEDTTRIPAPGEPPHHKYIPLPGQTVHVIEFPDGLAEQEAILALHLTHRVRVVGGVARLEPRGKEKSSRGKRKTGSARRTTKPR